MLSLTLLLLTLGQRDAKASANGQNHAQNGKPSSGPANSTKQNSATDDVVLNSVMAQFENLQKDRLRRRSTSNS